MARVTFKRGAKLDRIDRRLDNPEAALKAIGALMTAESQGAFKRQSFGKDRWPERARLNVFGIIADFHQGRRSPPARRFESRPALRDTGRLSSSIAFRLIGTHVVEVGSNLPYAGVHNFGGEVESKPITASVRSALWRWLKKQDRQMRRRLGWLLNKKFTGETLVSDVPARRFVGVTSRTQDYVQRAVGAEIMEAR